MVQISPAGLLFLEHGKAFAVKTSILTQSSSLSLSRRNLRAGRDPVSSKPSVSRVTCEVHPEYYQHLWTSGWHLAPEKAPCLFSNLGRSGDVTSASPNLQRRKLRSEEVTHQGPWGTSELELTQLCST